MRSSWQIQAIMTIAHLRAEVHATAIVVTNGARNTLIVIREVRGSGGIRCITVGHALLIRTSIDAVQQIAAIRIGRACIRLIGAWVILRAHCTGIAIPCPIARSAATALACLAGPAAIDVRFVAGKLSVEAVCRDIPITRIAFTAAIDARFGPVLHPVETIERRFACAVDTVSAHAFG